MTERSRNAIDIAKCRAKKAQLGMCRDCQRPRGQSGKCSSCGEHHGFEMGAPTPCPTCGAEIECKPRGRCPRHMVCERQKAGAA